MPQIIENFFENNIFTFQSYGCDCVEDIEHTVPGMPPIKTYKFQSDTEKPLLFGYRAKTVSPELLLTVLPKKIIYWDH